MRRHAARSAGFTLLEMLVALAVVGLLYSTVALGLHLGMQVRAKQAALRMDSWALADGWQWARRALAGMDPGSRARPGIFGAASDRLTFTTVMPDAGHQPVDAALLVDERRRLVLRWVSRTGGDPIRERVLADGVARLAVSYRGTGATDPWRSDWTDTSLPELVRVSVAWADQARRPWPPIIAGPVLRVARD